MDDAIFLASFTYKTEPALLTGLLEEAQQFNEASLSCQVNAKLKKHLKKTEGEWNTQLEQLSEKYSYLNNVHIQTGASTEKESGEEKEKKAGAKKGRRGAATASASGKEGGKTSGKRERRRRRG